MTAVGRQSRPGLAAACGLELSRADNDDLSRLDARAVRVDGPPRRGPSEAPFPLSQSHSEGGEHDYAARSVAKTYRSPHSDYFSRLALGLLALLDACRRSTK